MRIADPQQVILEAEPYRRLAYSWHSFTPELAEDALPFGDTSTPDRMAGRAVRE